MNFPVSLKLKEGIWLASQPHLEIEVASMTMGGALASAKSELEEKFASISDQPADIDLQIVSAKAEAEVIFPVNKTLGDFGGGD